jgi:hypothetical protein
MFVYVSMSNEKVPFLQVFSWSGIRFVLVPSQSTYVYHTWYRGNITSNTNMYLICIYVIGNEKNKFWNYLIWN